MPGRRIILPSAMFALVFLAVLSAQATRSAHADDECLAKPNTPAPQGQHWYYRIDHANNSRQCWRLAPEGLPVQKSAPQSENQSTASATAQPTVSPRAQRPLTAEQAAAHAEAAPDATRPVGAAPVLWLNAARLPDLPRAVQPALPEAAAIDSTTQSSDAAPADTSDPSPTGSIHTERPQRSAAPRSSPSAVPPRPTDIDHTFALLMVMFALLAVTGPILHFTHRQRHQRETINFKPPRWAPVVALNAPAPRIRPSQATQSEFARRPAARPIRALDPIERRLAPGPARPPEPNERLVQALQQLVNRMQTTRRTEPDTVPPPARRAGIDVMKSAR